jgi:hypothetical protein
MTSEDFFNDLVIQFPSIKSEVLENDPELIHIRMERFAGYTIKQIEDNNIQELKKCFDFQESKIDFMTANLKNALVVSYCEALLLGKFASKMKEVMKIMPTKLFTIYIEYEQYYNGLIKKHRQN